MNDYIKQFSQQLREAVKIGNEAKLNPSKNPITNVLICGIGGSGIGGQIVAKLTQLEANVPVATCNEYFLPAYVNQNTLVVASSYSGNTEEVLSLLDQAIKKGAEIACITSGGKVFELAEKNYFNIIKIPGGNPPRACLGYSFTQLLVYMAHYGIIKTSAIPDIESAIVLIDKEEEDILALATTTAKQLSGKIPIVYSSAVYDAVAVRFKQQLNENSKMLCWNNKFPELNHNEIVGWTKENQDLAVVFINDEDDFYRTKARRNFTEKLVQKYTNTICNVDVKGTNDIEKIIYLIHLTDWISVKIADLNGTDSIEIRVIDALKAELDILS